jgi:NADH:ubiquinone oxidoreductase subunit F (NADH-binding)/NADH:ubiquinone oxidoreductase subunit E
VSDWRQTLQAFPRERTWLLPALHAVQHDLRWIPAAALAEVAAHLRVPLSEAYGVATHYPEFRLAEPRGRIVRVCTGVSCRIRGSLDLYARLEAIDRSDTTLEPLDCAFNCAMAPVVELDGVGHGRVTGDELPRLLASSGAAIPPVSRRERRASSPASTPFAELSARAGASGPRGLTFMVGVGSCSLTVGAADTLASLRETIERRGLAATVITVGCNGLCWAAPLIVVETPEGVSHLLPHATADRIPALLDAAVSNRLEPHPGISDFLSHQRRELTSRCGLVAPDDIADAVRRGSYAALAAALDAGRPEAVIETLKAAGLRGRGGAYFGVGLKWEVARRSAGTPRYLIVNGEEGEPGIFKDRHLMEGDPHRLLEGALLAAYAAGAGRIYFYLHGEAHLSAARVAQAVEDARSWGLIGRGILGSDFSVEIEIRRGAGGFVLGEETALMESIEGRRAMPRPKPPFPTEAGLFGKPTVVHNVETLFAVPPIVEHGPTWWTALGQGHGTKCFGLSGGLARPGLVEVEMGATLRRLVETVGGGLVRGGTLAGVVLGGPSGIIVPPRDLDEPLLPGGRVNPGTGGVVALDQTVSIREVIRTLLDFNTRESCGKCTPCREGTARLRDLLAAGRPAETAAVGELSELVRLASLCGLGQAAPLSILSALRDFPGVL